MSTTSCVPFSWPQKRARQLHPFALGRPAGQVFQTVSTEHTPPHERYEHWTGTQIRSVAVDPPSEQQRHDFQAQIVSLATLHNEMHFSQSDGFSGVRTAGAVRADPSRDICLLYVLEGQVNGRFDNEEVTVSTGEFFLYDSRLVQRLEVSRHRLVQVDLSYAAVEAAFAGTIPTPTMVTKALASSRLTPLLRSHLAHFPHMAEGMSPLEHQRLLETTEAFALSILQGAMGNSLPDNDNRNQALILAAQRYIRHNIDNPDLSPAMVAEGIGCSRATLYRVFKQHDMTIAAYIREQRLQQLFGLLQNPADRRPIALLAQTCGLYDAPNVNQMFRRRFGANPSDVRAVPGNGKNAFLPPSAD